MKFRRIEKIVEARRQSAMDFLLEDAKHNIDGKRSSDYRLGWVIIENGVEMWVSDEQVKRDYVEISV